MLAFFVAQKKTGEIMSNYGFIKLHRKLQCSESSKCNPCTSLLWFYILLNAEYKTSGKFRRGELELKTITQLRIDLSWKSGVAVKMFSTKEMRNALDKLIELGMVTKDKSKGIILINNYDKYQSIQNNIIDQNMEVEALNDQDLIAQIKVEHNCFWSTYGSNSTEAKVKSLALFQTRRLKGESYEQIIHKTNTISRTTQFQGTRVSNSTIPTKSYSGARKTKTERAREACARALQKIS